MALTDKLTAIANAIREKTGGTELLTLDQMPTEIAGIETGGGSSDAVDMGPYRYMVVGTYIPAEDISEFNLPGVECDAEWAYEGSAYKYLLAIAAASSVDSSHFLIGVTDGNGQVCRTISSTDSYFPLLVRSSNSVKLSESRPLQAGVPYRYFFAKV